MYFLAVSLLTDLTESQSLGIPPTFRVAKIFQAKFGDLEMLLSILLTRCRVHSTLTAQDRKWKMRFIVLCRNLPLKGLLIGVECEKCRKFIDIFHADCVMGVYYLYML